jgi:hypothetical protein
MTGQLRIEQPKPTPAALSVVEIGKAVGMLLLGAAALVAAIAFTAPAAGSYQLYQLGEYRRDQFLLNTRTGKVWEKVCIGTTSGATCDGDLMWEEVKRAP